MSHSATVSIRMSFSFLFRIDHVYPNWQGQAIQQFGDGGWKPPTWAVGLHTTETGRLYRWRSGSASLITMNDGAYGAIAQNPQAYQYSAGTVFTQMPSSQKFLAVNFDARWTNIDPEYRWEKLMFNHIPHPNGQNRYYSDLGLSRFQHHLATFSSVPWQYDLFPMAMHCDVGDTAASYRQNAGLIGSLPFILAVIAFSAPQEQLATILQTCLRPAPQHLASQSQWQHIPGQVHGSKLHISFLTFAAIF